MTDNQPSLSTWIYRDLKLHTRPAADSDSASDLDSHSENLYPTTCERYRRCRLKSCSYCSRKRGQRIASNIHARTTSDSSYYHLVLTLPASSSGPAAQAKHLIQQFAVLRRRAACKSLIGGVRKVDVSYDAVSQLWRCHLHVFAEASGDIDAAAISYQWACLTGGTDNVIKSIDSDSYRRNVTAYVARPPQLQLFGNADALAKFIRDSKGTRLMATFGNFRGTPLTARPLPQTPADEPQTPAAPPIPSGAADAPEATAERPAQRLIRRLLLSNSRCEVIPKWYGKRRIRTRYPLIE